MAKKKTSSKAQATAQEPATEKDVRVRVFEGHKGEVWRVAMPADGRFALTTSDGPEVGSGFRAGCRHGRGPREIRR